VCNIYDATVKIIAVAKVKANIVIHICSSIAWQAGAPTDLSATGAWAILVSLDGAAADDSGSMRLILKTSETFVRHWQSRPLTDSKRATPLGKGPVGVSIAVGAVPLSHVVETCRLVHHIGRMSRKEPKRSGRSDQNKAIARWDNEGGAPKGAPQEDRNELAPLTNEEEHVLRCLGAAVIMQWNDLPTKIQRELFEHASSMGELNHTAELKGQLARFLHQHKDDGRESA
jgi:hypothetical protein